MGCIVQKTLHCWACFYEELILLENCIIIAYNFVEIKVIKHFLEEKYNEFWVYKFKYLNITSKSRRPTYICRKLNFNFAIFKKVKEKLVLHTNFMMSL